MSVDGVGQGRDLGRVAPGPKAVAEPLDGRPGDERGALQGVRGAVVASPSRQPTVVSSPFVEATVRRPVFMSRNAPVP